MHIKQVLISGFRSFKSQSEIESFSPKHNVIVGRNGSGKSNFFDAIQFVLVAPKFATLRQEDRQNLLHEGAGSSVMAAYVEIIFDNSDGRFSVDSDEVVLRRTVGHKKDEFFLNRKRIQKSEVVSLLESAGFSKSNPYYIVQQGKVANLCLMKDKDRLNLLKEVAGTTVYEERRNESIKIMEETASKQVKVEEVLAFIEERLTELDEEKKELAEYELFDKQRRALEYNLYEAEHTKAAEQLQELENDRESAREKQQNLFAELRTAQDEVNTDEDMLSTLKITVDRLTHRKDEKQQELLTLQSKSATAETDIQDIETTIVSNNQIIKESKKQLEDIVKQIDKAQEQLNTLEPQFIERENQLQQQVLHFNQLRKRVDALYGKQGRNVQFRNKEERDNFLQQQIQTLQTQLLKKTQNYQSQQQSLEEEGNHLIEEKLTIEKLEKENELRLRRCEELNTQIHNEIKQRNELQEIRKNNWRELELLQEKDHDAKLDLGKAKQQLNRSLPRNITQGLATIEAIVNEKQIQGYYGPLIDNISLKADAFRIPVEVAGGNSLFHILVDNDQTASLLIYELEKRNGGRLTFLPLSKIRPKIVKYPDSTDVRPLIQVALTYEPEVAAAVQMVFGPKLLARDLDAASHYSRESKIDCITMEGDVVNHRGAYEGGYYDDRMSKILAVLKIRLTTQKLIEIQETEKQLKTQSEQYEQKISDLLRSLQKLESERDHLRAHYERQSKELIQRKRKLEMTTKIITDGKITLQTLLQEITTVEEQIYNYTNEMNSPLVSTLSEQERLELTTTEEELRSIGSMIEQRKNELAIIQSSCEQLSEEIKHSFMKRREEIEGRIRALSGDSSSSGSSGNGDGNGNERSNKHLENELINIQMEYHHIQKSIVVLQQDITQLEQTITSKQHELNTLENVLDKKKETEKTITEEVSELTKLLDKYFNKRSILLETIQLKKQQIRDLGSVPKKELEEYSKKYSQNKEKLLLKLKDINESLKKCNQVNRKALDQYISFHEQRETLLQRKNEMNRDTKAIQQLIQSLDAQKDEAILRTFRGVSQHFTEVFQELVPTGTGKLIMKTSLEGGAGEEEEDFVLGKEEQKKTSSQQLEISTFRGIQVSVSFTGSGQHYQMNQLSGGQKAVVALALIFAIQRCDPAPFYLFDEIDQALDANYRNAVARLIQKQANSETAPAQFITTTFRPELVIVADKFFGIALMNKVSNLYPLDKGDAQDFVTNLMKEEEAVGKASTVPSYTRAQRQSSSSRSQQIAEGEEEEEEGEEELPRKGRARRRRTTEREYEEEEGGGGGGGEYGEGDGEGEDEDKVELDPEEEVAFHQLGLDEA